jgi:DEAD/DEAH box helicase domain-containing protein
VFWPRAINSDTKPIAVYTDGYAFHVRPNELVGRIGDDIQKRMGLIKSGNFLVWTVTWDDVQEFEEDQPNLTLSVFTETQRRFLKNLLIKSGNPLFNGLLEQNAIKQFIAYLQHPSGQIWHQYIGILSLALASPPRPPVPRDVLVQKRVALMTEEVSPSLTIPQDVEEGNYIYSVYQHYLQPFHFLLYFPKDTINDEDFFTKINFGLRLDDQPIYRRDMAFKRHWRKTFLTANICQFLPKFLLRSTEEIKHLEMIETGSESLTSTSSSETNWDEVRTYVDPECYEMVDALQAAQLPKPTVGYELQNDDDQIVAMAEIAWEEKKIAVLLLDNEYDISVFQNEGWAVMHSDAIQEVIEAVQSQGEGR